MSISQNQKIKNSQPHIKVNGPYENKECCSFYLLGWMEIDLLHSGFSIFHFTFNNILSLNKDCTGGIQFSRVMCSNIGYKCKFICFTKIQRYPVDTGGKLNVHKTFRRRPGRLLNVLCTFNLPPVSTGYNVAGLSCYSNRHILVVI